MKRKVIIDYVKAARRASREAEIEIYEHPLPKRKVHQSKKTYNRQQLKAGKNDLFFLFPSIL